MFNKKILFFINLLFLFVFFGLKYTAEAQELIKDPDKPSGEEISNEYNKESATREKKEAAADAEVALAGRAFEQDRYAESIALYLSAIKKLELSADLSSYVDGKIKNIKNNMAIVYHYWARSIAAQAEKDMEEEKFDEAMKKCAEAVKMDPSLAKKI